jgi:hypothetical protein
MLESVDDEGSKIDWIVVLQYFQMGAFTPTTFVTTKKRFWERNIKPVLEDQMDVLSEMQLVIPVEGRDYGILRSE